MLCPALLCHVVGCPVLYSAVCGLLCCAVLCVLCCPELPMHTEPVQAPGVGGAAHTGCGSITGTGVFQDFLWIF